MSNSCRLWILGHLFVGMVSCAERADPVRAAARPQAGPAAIVFEAEPALAAAAQAENPYAPIGSAKGGHFTWQSRTRAECSRVPAATLDRAAEFRGSAVALPLPQGELLPAKRSETRSTWGGSESLSGDPLGPSPDLVVASLRPRLHHCFARWLDDKADAEGSVRFSLELGCAGAVESISADVRGVDAPALECLFSVMAPARFAPPASGHATLAVPVVFKNASR